MAELFFGGVMVMINSKVRDRRKGGGDPTTDRVVGVVGLAG